MILYTTVSGASRAMGYPGYVHLFGWACSLKVAVYRGLGLCGWVGRCTFGRPGSRTAKAGYVHLGVRSPEMGVIKKSEK